MPDKLANTQRIAKNTLLLYARMLFNLVVSLYASRLVLQALGVEDYGIYNVVGGFVSMFSMISGSLSSASSRFLTFELGRNDESRLKQMFATSFTIQILLAVVILLLCESVGLWYMNSKMVIPPERMYAARWVFQFSMLTFLSSLLIVPFNAAIIAHERMDFFAYVSIFEVLAKLAIVLFLAYSNVSADRLILYAALLVVAKFSTQAIYYFYCRKHFPECRLGISTDKESFKGLIGFASWNFLGTTASVLSDQGVNMILNVTYGPVLNAARGLSVTVSNIVNNFVNNFTMALNPQITKSYAAGDMDYMRFLVFRGAKFSLYIMMVLALPIELETPFILHIWLGTVPEHTVNFVRLVLIFSFSAIFSNILGMAQLSTGKVRNYQIVNGLIVLLNFPLAYIMLKGGRAPEIVYIIGIALTFGSLVARLVFVHHSIGLPVKDYVKEVILNVLLVLAVSVALPLIVRLAMPEGWLRFLLVTAVCLAASVLAVLYVGCNKEERGFILDSARRFLSKFRKTKTETA